MGFISDDDVRKMRLKGAKPFSIDGLDKKLNLVKMSSSATLEMADLEQKLKKGEATQRAVFAFLLANAVSDDKGNLIGDEAASELMDLVPMPEVVKVLKSVAGDVDAAAKVASAGNPSVGSLAGGSPSA